MKKLKIPEKELLYKLYETEQLSLSKMAVIFNISVMTVRAWLINYGIETRIATQSIYQEIRFIDFNEEQKSLLLGSILGDGGLRIPKKGKNAHFYERHCEKQLPYLVWKRDKLMPFVQKKIDMESGGDHIISGVKCVVQNSYKITTVSHTHLTDLWKIFYRGNGNKILPSNIDEYLNLFVIAVWICDDGSLVWNNIRRTYRIDLHTENFTYDENVIICRALSMFFKGSFMIIPRSYDSGKRYYISFRGKKELHDLCSKLIAFVPDCMKYKFQTHI